MWPIPISMQLRKVFYGEGGLVAFNIRCLEENKKTPVAIRPYNNATGSKKKSIMLSSGNKLRYAAPTTLLRRSCNTVKSVTELRVQRKKKVTYDSAARVVKYGNIKISLARHGMFSPPLHFLFCSLYLPLFIDFSLFFFSSGYDYQKISCL